MAALLDLDRFTFHGKLLQSVSELIFEDTIKGPNINMIHTVFTGVVGREEVGFIGKGGKIGVKGQGCNPTPQAWQANTRLLVWDPERWEVLLTACFTDLETTAALYSLRVGRDIPDFTDTDYMNIVLELLTQSMEDFWWRLFWFNEKDAANFPTGIITAGEDLQYFNIIDGFWKQIFDQITTNPAQHTVTITENAGATYADQEMDPDNVIKYIQDVIYRAPRLLRQQPDGFVLVPQRVYDALEQALSDKCCLESSRALLMNGATALMIKGVPVIPILIWDEMIEMYNDSGTAYYNPNRILYTTKAVLGVAVDTEESFGRMNVWYDRDSRLVKMETMGRADAKLTNPLYFSFGV